MQINLNKNELAGALAALGKLVCRLSPIQVYRAVQIEANNNTLFFRTHNLTEQIEFRMNADLEDDISATLAEFEPFRLAVRNCKNKTLKLEIESDEVFIEGVKLNPVKGDFPEPERIPEQDNVATTPLPENFVEMLSAAAPLIDLNEARNILHGMNLSADGLTAANCKELFNCPYPFKLDELTIPFPLVLMATKASGAGELKAWNNDLYTLFTVSIGNWTWTARALPGAYPNWKRVMPNSKDMKHSVSFSTENADRLRLFLKTVPETKTPNGIHLYRDEEGTLTLRDKDGHDCGISAEFVTWDDFRVVIRKENLQHLLNQGHTALAFIDGMSPFIGSGGVGQYIAMPMCARISKEEAAQTPKQAASAQSDAKPEIQTKQSKPHQVQEFTESVSVQNSTRPQEPQTIINTNPNKENPIMETNTITRTVSAPVQTSATNAEPEKELTPIAELTAKIEAMKAVLKEMLDDATTMSRKVREVALTVKQKEREALVAKRAIERVRMAI